MRAKSGGSERLALSSAILSMKAAKSLGLRLVMRFPSTTTASSIQSAPEFPRGIRCRASCSKEARLYEEAWPMADRRDRLSRVCEGAYEGYRPGIGAQAIGVDEAPGAS